MRMAKTPTSKTVKTIKHDEATRKNIPTAEYQSVLQKEEQNPVRIAYERRSRDLEPNSGRIAVKVINHLGDEG